MISLGKVRWNDKDSVIEYARYLAEIGGNQVVYKRSDRVNYNICHGVSFPLTQLKAVAEGAEITFSQEVS